MVLTETNNKHFNIVNRDINISHLIKLAVLALIHAHFIWATWYYITKIDDPLSSTTCNGYGFYMILMIFINFGVLYKLVFKPFLLPEFNTYIWRPWITVFRKTKYSKRIFLAAILLAILAFVVYDASDDFRRLIPFSGLVIFLLIGFVVSPYKNKIPWDTVLSGMIAQFAMGLFLIRWEVGRNIFSCVGDKVDSFLHYAVNASAFVYGDDLVLKQAVFAFNALAAIYLMSFFINILFYYGIMQGIVLKLGMILQWLLGTPICESVNSAGNIFLGMSESPFLIKPYLDHLTESEIHSIMTSGFASVSGTVLAAYISFGADPGHLITSCVMSAPAALCYSKLMYPETQDDVVAKEHIKAIKLEFDSVLSAAIKGANEAAAIVIGIISNVIAFVATVYFINGVLAWLGTLVGFTAEKEIWSLELILGKVLIPLAYTMGVEWDDCEKVGQLIGIKTVVNEFVAFQKMQSFELSEKSKIVATYALCGFTNPGAMGILVSALGAYMPNKKELLNKLALRAFLGGSMVCFMTACVAALLTR